MNSLRHLFIGFLIGNTVRYYAETLDLSAFVAIASTAILLISYLWLEIAINKKYEQKDTQ